jgi:hypothetical protein
MLPAEDIRLEELNALLVDCVEGGGGVSFMLPFRLADVEK